MIESKDERGIKMTDQIKVRVGYACLNLSLKDSFKNYRLATVEKKEEEKITQVIWHNIRLLEEIIHYNIRHNIYVYRISSDLIPFCTHPYIRSLYEEKVCCNEEMQACFQRIREKQEEYRLRLSIHPSQFNVLSSPRKEVVARSIEEVNAQTEWVKQVGGENVIIHVGGIYGDKESAIRRFKENLKYVDQQLISIENDDKTYHTEDVVGICEPNKLKWVYDYHHDRCYPSLEAHTCDLIRSYPPSKYHLSSGTPYCHSRPHADYISKNDYKHFVQFLQHAGIREADVVFEAKNKNRAIFHILEPEGQGYWHLES